MLFAPDRGVLRLTGGAVRAAAILAAVGLLAGCLGSKADGIGRTGYSADGNGANNALVVNGNGGTDSDGTGGNGGNVNGNNGLPGASGASGTDGAAGAGNSDSGSVVGSGRLVSQLIALPGVTSVGVGASFVVHLAEGEPEQATIRLDDNLTDQVDATVTDGTLRLGLKPGSNVRNATLSAEVTVRHLDRLATSGASQVTLVSPPTSPALQLDASSASRVTGPVKIDHLEASESGASILALSGNARSLHLSAAGTSQLLGSELTIADLDAVLSGASQGTVAVSDALAVTAGGASVLRYRGTPSITRQDTSGVSSILQDRSNP